MRNDRLKLFGLFEINKDVTNYFIKLNVSRLFILLLTLIDADCQKEIRLQISLETKKVYLAYSSLCINMFTRHISVLLGHITFLERIGIPKDGIWRF